jgi:hypothetical protein
MYNIAKVAKGEILPFFNEVFDALSKVRALAPRDGKIFNVLIVFAAGRGPRVICQERR